LISLFLLLKLEAMRNVDSSEPLWLWPFEVILATSKTTRVA